MDPQERTGRHPVFEFFALKEPLGRPLIMGLACNVVICGGVRRRKPFVDVLFYLCPCKEDLVSTMDAIRAGGYRHFTSSTSCFTVRIALLVISAPKWMRV